MRSRASEQRPSLAAGRWPLVMGLALLLSGCSFDGALRLGPARPAAGAPTHAPATPTPSPTVTPTATPTPSPTVTPAPTSTPAPPAAAGYAGHVVAEGETLERIAAAGGSTPDSIRSYNRLRGDPAQGRALIVPRLEGRTSALENQGILVRRGPAERPWVALTLDAGAGSEPVPGILQTLRERKVAITFFLTGQWIRDNPDLVRQIVADGHEIANHTFSHPDLTRLSDGRIRDELAQTEAQLQEVAGVGARPFFRPPYGAYNERVLEVAQRAGYLPVYWTLDSLDSIGEPKTPAFLLERVTAKLAPAQLRGAIILAHCGSAATAQALPSILDRFAAMGFEVKTLSEVLDG